MLLARMKAQIIIASTDPVVASALTEQLRDAGFSCAEGAGDIALCDADAPAETGAPRALYLASDVGNCPQPALQKPVRRGDLLARLLRMVESSGERLLADGWVLNPAERRLKRADNTLELTEKEAELLICLLAAPSRTAPRRKLLEEVWGYKRDTDTHTLETHVHRLRAKLKDIGGEGWIVATVDGYRIES